MKSLKSIIAVVLFLISFSASAQIYVRVKPVIPRNAIVVSNGRAQHGHVWINGHWVVQGNSYVWRDGYYTKNRHGYRYVPGHWKNTKRGWVWVPERWKRCR